jgi:hypothetical protein
VRPTSKIYGKTFPAWTCISLAILHSLRRYVQGLVVVFALTPVEDASEFVGDILLIRFEGAKGAVTESSSSLGRFEPHDVSDKLSYVRTGTVCSLDANGRANYRYELSLCK